MSSAPTGPPPASPAPGPSGDGASRLAGLWRRFRGLPLMLQLVVGLLLLALPGWALGVASAPGDDPAVDAAEADEPDAEPPADDPPGDDHAADELTPEDPAAPGDADQPDPDPPAPEPEPDPAPADGLLEVHYLDVGQADATLLLHDEVALLIDTGHWQRSDVVPYLRDHGVDRLDVVLITHPHADHIGQFDQVMDGLEVDEVWWSGSTTTTLTFSRALGALERSGAAYEEPRAGDSTTVGPLTVEVVNPPTGVDLADLHDAGLAVRVTYGAVSFLFSGDAEAVTERRMVDRSSATLVADILQAGHHGSSTSTTPAFLAAVQPAVAVYSAGAGNQYGHPHAEVLDRLSARGVDIYGTDVHGHVLVSTDGTGWSVETRRAGAVTVPGPAPPPEPEADPEATARSSAACAHGQVDINRAGREDLQQIVHIGPTRADELVTLRPFSTVRDLTRINGIAEGRLRDILDQGVACVS